MSKITEPGFYQIAPADYHADPCATPSLSNSIAKKLIWKSPRHAWQAHPRLNPRYRPYYDRTKEIGSVAHALFLGVGSKIVAIDDDDYRAKAAKDARRAAYEAGHLPILAPDLDRAQAMVEIARAEFSRYPEIAPAIREGQSELVGVAREGDTWLRIMLDRSSTDLLTLLDYKTTGNAHPDAAAARISDNDFQMQHPFYVRVLDTLHPEGAGRRRFFFLYQEQDEPFACTVHELEAHHRTIGERQVEAAVQTWARCMATNTWPAYPRVIHRVEMRPWAETSWLAREVADAEREEQEHRGLSAADLMGAG